MATYENRVALPNNIITEIQTLPPSTIELGLGCHGEPGLRYAASECTTYYTEDIVN